MSTIDTGRTAVDQDLIDMMRTVFAAHREATADGPARPDWDLDLWASLDELGLARLTGAEEHGGSGAGWPEAAELLRAAAIAGVAAPLVEHDLLAGWLLERAGIEPDGARRTAAVLDASGAADAVGWADAAERLTVLHRGADGLAVSDLAREDVAVTPGRNIAGQPRDAVRVDLTALGAGTPVAADTAELFVLRGSLARSVQTAAALEAVLGLAIEHTTTRVQFGRPLSRFQSVQHAIAEIAAEAALARAATEAAVNTAADPAVDAARLALPVAVARSCAGHAASVVVRAGHQLHGAIGTTREHRLHEFTRPALAWRAEFGSVADWDRRVARAARAAGGDGLWALITA